MERVAASNERQSASRAAAPKQTESPPMARLHEHSSTGQARRFGACINRHMWARNRFPTVRSRKIKMDKGGVVREMFDRIANRYDLTNTVMTGGIDALWRRRAVSMLDVAPHARLLDLCCGTGVMT